jgi:hypothetical protein
LHKKIYDGIIRIAGMNYDLGIAMETLNIKSQFIAFIVGLAVWISRKLNRVQKVTL